MNIQPTVNTGGVKTNDCAAVAVVAPVKTAAIDNTVNEADAIKSTEPTRDQLKSAVNKLNQSMTGASQDLEFSVDENSKRTIVKLIDRNTHEVLRQMPTKEALEIAKSMDKAIGKLIDHKT